MAFSFICARNVVAGIIRLHSDPYSFQGGDVIKLNVMNFMFRFGIENVASGQAELLKKDGLVLLLPHKSKKVR